MSKQFLDAIKEMVKEAARIAIFAAFTAVIAYLSQQLELLDPTSMFYIIGTLVIRLADKFIHEHKKIKANGLVPF